MSATITNRRNQTSFHAERGETILDAALRQQHVFAYGCRSGACGACKSVLVSGKVDYGAHEEFALSAEEIAAGKVLLCRAVALEDVVIDAEEVASGHNIQIKMLPCRVARMQQAAKDVMRVFLMLPKTQEFNFLPGQYIDIIMKDGARRSFSIANLPARAREEGLELHIRHVPGGHFTPRVFASLRERDLLRFEGPFGTYFLREEETRPRIMVAGGTGFAPLKALAQQALDAGASRPLHLFWGARDAQDLYMHELAESWAREHANFSYTPVLSESADGWNGARGWVHESVAAAYENFSEFDVYASGPPVMVDALRDALLAKNMQAERFFFDAFTYAPHA